MWQHHQANVRTEIFSENRQYSAEIHVATRDLSGVARNRFRSPELVVFKRTGESKDIVWRKPIEILSADGGDIPIHSFRHRAHLTNDGRIAAVWVQIFSDPPVLYILSRDNQVSLNCSDLLAVLPPQSDEEFRCRWMVSHESLDLLGHVNGEDLYALWISSIKQWVVSRLDEPRFRIPSPLETDELHQQMLRRCRETVAIYEARKRDKEKPREVIEFSDVANAYRFIAMNGEDADKPAAERMLAAELRGGFRSCPPLGFPGIELNFSSAERALGAELLANWAKRGLEEPVGAIAGVVRFPFPLPKPPGTLLLTLTPVVQGSDGNTPSQIRIEFALPEEQPSPMPRRKNSRPDRLRFRVGTLTPGEYRLKVVWERRSRMHTPPWIERDATPNSKGGAYESKDSDKIAVGRGEVIHGIQLECIDRVSADATLYTNDQPMEAPSLVTESQATMTVLPESSPPETQIKLLFAGPAQAGIIDQQQSEAKIILRELRLEQFLGRGARGGKELKITFIHLGLKNRRLRFEAELKDDAGKRYQGGVFGFREVREACFAIVPFRSKTFTLSIFTFDEELPTTDLNDRSTAYQDTFELRNVLTVAENRLIPEPLPVLKVLDILAIELRGLKPSRWAAPGSRSVEPVFRVFDEDGRDSSAWKVCAVLFQDSLGNSASSPDELPLDDSVLKMQVRFARDIHTGRFNKDEQWQFQVPRMPAPREFLDLRRIYTFPEGSIEVFGIGGPGIFTYQDGKVLSASDLSVAEKEPLRVEKVQSDPETHFHVSGSSGFGVSFPISGSRRVVSRWPYLVFRKTLSNFAVDIRIKEEAPIENMVHFHTPPQRSEIVFVPLWYHSGDLDKTVTIIAQRPREAEFVIQLPD